MCVRERNRDRQTDRGGRELLADIKWSVSYEADNLLKPEVDANGDGVMSVFAF